jgi:hypothetical protein
MRRIPVVLSLLVLLLGVMASPAAAQVPPPHDHFSLDVPGTGDAVQVGPPRCRLGVTVQGAFLNFHVHVHLGTPTVTGAIAIVPGFCP